MTGKQIVFLIFCALALLTFQSCKKGCTDKNAINYTTGAKDNDGTCLYCDSSTQVENFNEQNIQDNNTFQEVLFLYVENRAQVFTGNGCQKYNISGGSTSCLQLIHDGFLLNTTNQTIIFTGEIEVEYNSQQNIIYNFNSAQIGPLDTLKIGKFGPACVSNNDPFFDLFILQGYSIQYK